MVRAGVREQALPVSEPVRRRKKHFHGKEENQRLLLYLRMTQMVARVARFRLRLLRSRATISSVKNRISSLKVYRTERALVTLGATTQQSTTRRSLKVAANVL